MKMAKASERDLKMALDLASMLEGFDRGHFPPKDDDEDDEFCPGVGSDCMAAMDTILDKLTEGSLFRVVFGMSVVLDPRNEVVDPDADCLDLHPKHKAAQETIAALRARVAELEAASEITPDFCGYVWDYDNPEDSNEDTFGEYLDNQCDQETGPVLGMERRVTIAKKLPDVLLTVTEVDEHDRPKAWSVEIIKKEVRRG